LEIILEFIVDLVFELSVEGATSKNIPFWLRLVCAFVVGLVFAFIIAIIIFLAFQIWEVYYHLPSILLLLLALSLIIGLIIKFKIIKLKSKGA